MDPSVCKPSGSCPCCVRAQRQPSSKPTAPRSTWMLVRRPVLEAHTCMAPAASQPRLHKHTATSHIWTLQPLTPGETVLVLLDAPVVLLALSLCPHSPHRAALHVRFAHTAVRVILQAQCRGSERIRPINPCKCTVLCTATKDIDAKNQLLSKRFHKYRRPLPAVFFSHNWPSRGR
jgi:hypothetical protein